MGETAFVFPTKTTGEVKFLKVITPNAFVSRVDAEGLQAARADFRAALKAGDSSGILAAAEAYLPWLFSLFRLMTVDDPSLSSFKDVVEFPWKSALIPSAKSHMEASAAHYELGNGLTALAFAQCSSAHEALTDAMNTVAPLEAAVKFDAAAEAWIRAAGIFAWWADVGSRQWTNLPAERPPEVIKEAAAALSILSLAEAQRVAIAKSEATHMTSFTLMAKLAKDCGDKFAEAHTMLKSLPHDYPDVSGALKEYLDVMSRVVMPAHVGLLTAQEYFKNDKTGNAVALVSSALALLTSTKASDSAALKSILSSHIKDATKMSAHYSRINDTVFCEPVPSKDFILDLLPNMGKSLVAAKPFVPPKPLAFSSHQHL